MRWKQPKHNDTRRINKFLWIPLELDGEKRWLEFASYDEYYSATYPTGWWKQRNRGFIDPVAYPTWIVYLKHVVLSPVYLFKWIYSMLCLAWFMMFYKGD